MFTVQIPNCFTRKIQVGQGWSTVDELDGPVRWFSLREGQLANIFQNKLGGVVFSRSFFRKMPVAEIIEKG